MSKKSHKETSTSTPWGPAQPMLLGAGQGITNTVNANAGNLQSQEAMLNGQLPGLFQQATNSGTLAPGSAYNASVLNGSFLNSNPYTLAMTQQAGNDAANHVNAAFSMAGRTGGGDHAMQLGKGVDQAENNVLFQNYQNERGQQTATAAQLPAYQQAQNGAVSTALQATQLAGQLPYYGAQALSGIGGLYSGYGTNTATKPGGWGTDLLGAAGAALPFIFASARELKTDIEQAGEAPDGLGIYTWRYKNDPSRHVYRGVMADEVEKLRPWALVKGFVNGIHDGVNYAALGAM